MGFAAPLLLPVSSGEPMSFRRIGWVSVPFAQGVRRLGLFWMAGYAGGLFLPFRDTTSGRETYGGGRYLFDTAKDTDGLVLEITPGSSDVTIDFNYAYNASCAYSPRWACPLAPPENYLKVPVRAGELSYKKY